MRRLWACWIRCSAGVLDSVQCGCTRLLEIFACGMVWVVAVSVFIFTEGRLALVGLRSFNEFGVVSELRCSIGWCSFGDVLELRSCCCAYWCGFFAGSGLQFRCSTLLVCWWGDQQCWSRSIVCWRREWCRKERKLWSDVFHSKLRSAVIRVGDVCLPACSV